MNTRYVRFIDKELHVYMLQLAYETGVSYESVKLKTFSNGKFYEFVMTDETKEKIGDYIRKRNEMNMTA